MNFLETFSKYPKFMLWSILCLAIVAFFSKLLAVGFIFIVFLCAITLSLTLSFINKNKEHAKVLTLLFLIVFLIHIVFVLFIYYTHFQPFSGGDYREYNTQAQKIANRIHQGNFSLQGIGVSHYYPVIVGYIYALTIPDMLMGQLFNAWLSAILVIFAYLIVIEIGASPREGFWTGLIISVYPSLVFFGSLMLKDIFVALFCTIGLLFMLKIIKNFSWNKFFILYLALIGLTHFRFYISLSFVFSFIICWFFFSNLKIKERLIYGAVMVILLAFLPNVSGGSGEGMGYFGKDTIKEYLNPQQITHLREVVYAPPSTLEENQPPPADQNPQEEPPPLYEPFGRNESSFAVETNIDNPLKFSINYLKSFIYVVLGPFPWQMTQPKHFFALPEVIAWWFLLFFIVKGIIKSFKTKYKIILPLVIFSCFVFGVLALFITNFGVVTRIRIPAFISLLYLLPFGFGRLKNIKIPFLNNLNC